jgi:hypothetical protein
MPVVPAVGRLRQKDCEFKARLGYLVKPCLQKKKERKNISFDA